MANDPSPARRSNDLAELPLGSSATGGSGWLPMSAAEMRDRGWDSVDVVFVTGDAYVDHPSFAMAVLTRVLDAAGFRVGVLSQPDWHACDAWKTFGRPRLFFAVSAGNMDSMINHYTANRKVRNDDAYSPGGRIGLRPDRATLAYCQRAREAYKGVPVIAGGVEPSLRRLAHYDYWSDKVRRSIVLDSKADLVVYGMGEEAIVEIARRLDGGESVRDLRDMRGIAFALGASEAAPNDAIVLPSYEQVVADKRAFADATRRIHDETNPFNAKRLVQFHDRQAVVANPPRFPLAREAIDRVYGLPFLRRPHPSYRDPIPAFETIKDSVTILRGCFGGCTFCSITTHQGRIIQSRSRESVLSELAAMGRDRDFSGVVSDLGGPTANMYAMGCTRPEVEAVCRRQSCAHPSICKLLGANHGPLIGLMRTSRDVPGVKKVLIASGIRMDLANRSPDYMRELTHHHVGGHLKVAPEHVDPEVLDRMRKPCGEDFERFTAEFERESGRAGKRQYIVPYFIASHPGSDLDSMVQLAVYLKQTGYRPDQVQDFIPAPMDVATAMYHTGLDPWTGKRVFVAKSARERRRQRALMQFFKPENYQEVREALIEAGRRDLIGDEPDCLIPAERPSEPNVRRTTSSKGSRTVERPRPSKRTAIQKRRGNGRGKTGSGSHGSTAEKDGKRRESRHRPGKGYRPGRKGAGSS
ncbi:MAG: YgiQ family radical SAM protein [Planctomycetes bacterium]|nr:YgiQ family radical SAM protein [Planctomycetota bacterium]